MSMCEGAANSSRQSSPSIESKVTQEKLKKAPQAPKRFKSAFIFFSTEKHREIRRELGTKGATEKTTNVAKMVSQAWKTLHPEEREKWEEMSRRDKIRYEVEKKTYSGPWKVPASKRLPKDPNAPKRPMSAFLSFSNNKRALIKSQNPTVSNADISRLLSRMWRDAPEDERRIHIDNEYILRLQYKAAIAEWRANNEREKEVARLQREERALLTAEAQERQMFQSSGIPEGVANQHIEGVGPFSLYASHLQVPGGPMASAFAGTNQLWNHNSPPSYGEGQNESYTGNAAILPTQSLPLTNDTTSNSYPYHGGGVYHPQLLPGSVFGNSTDQQYFHGNVMFQPQQHASMPQYEYGYGIGSRPSYVNEEYASSSTGHEFRQMVSGMGEFLSSNAPDLGSMDPRTSSRYYDSLPNNNGYQELEDSE